MLNITENSVARYIKLEDFRSYYLLKKNHIKRLSLVLISLSIIGVLVFLFLPWTQNINSKGYVTTRSPEQRPQGIQSVIAGQIQKWYVQEGDFVEAGDTIVFISEVKSEYFNPNLIDRTQEQLDAKAQSIESYDQKIKALDRQYDALNKALKLKKNQIENKILQAINKISIDSIDLVALEGNLAINVNQYERAKALYNKGLETLTKFQDKEFKVQTATAKVNSQKNKLLNQRNELTNLKIELFAVEQEYADKISKSQSDKQSALSAKLQSVAETAKLQNQLSNYTERQKFYYITSPQSGFVTKTIKKGVGETLKEGSDVVTIMPSSYELAVEVYVLPQDLPLLSIGNRVRLRFDGWPAIVISGWPEASTGIFTGKIVAIDRFLSDNGYYRIMISPDKKEKEWPEQLRVGTGVSSFILLKDVPIWYELWRQLNGFPPDYYKVEKENEGQLKRKAPLKSVK